MSKTTFLSITPMVPTGGSLADALNFYKEQMGFSLLWEADRMAGIGRDGIRFNLIENDNREWAENTSFSIGISNLDALYEEYRGIAAQVGPLEKKAWGRREFHMIVPSGVCSSFIDKKTWGAPRSNVCYKLRRFLGAWMVRFSIRRVPSQEFSIRASA
jgi:hypothetical protein